MNTNALRHLVFAAIRSVALLCIAPSAWADALDNWTTNQVSTNWFGLTHVVYGNGRFVAAGSWSDYVCYLSSEDGLEWTLRHRGDTNASGSGIVRALVYTAGRFLSANWAMGSGVGESANGIHWSYNGIGPGPGSANANGIAYGNGTYVVVCTDSGIYYSNNGTSWTPAYKYPEETRAVWDVAFGNDLFVAVAAGGYSYVSLDGMDWFRIDGTGGNSITFAAGRFFVPLGPGTMLISTDEAHWATVPTGLSTDLGKISFANGRFFARAGDYLATSLDGTNWIQHTSSVLPGNGGIASDGRRFVNVGSGFANPPSPLYFDGYVYVSDPLVNLAISDSTPPSLILSGLIGRSYRVEYLLQLPQGGTNAWQTLSNLVLPSSPFLIADPGAPDSVQRFYRAVLLP